MREFNYNQLIAFVKVAEHLNISEAAKQLNKSRATISEHIDALECDLGHKLFDRSGRQIRLTELGEKFFRPSVLLLRQIYTWQNNIEILCPGKSKVSLDIAYDRVMPEYMVKNLLRYAQSHDMDLELIATSSDMAQDLLEKEIVDLIITTDEESYEFEWKLIGFMPYRFYAHKDFFPSSTIDLSDLLNKTQLLPNAYINKSKDIKFIFTPNNKIINDIEPLKYALQQKSGWAFLPLHLDADKWDDIIEIDTTLGKEGFVTPVVARWRPGEELIVSPILEYFENGNAVQAYEQ